ncbi:hypothetical protein RGQ29_030564 [Quercus rubra]|uniref:Uncharacterized protein n=1 Tax=Quercus rubra TaxID=3512 RepID=A0AAN7IAT7_QUERU|nr:hypothetical protein RGQ29_030564 [Quercus rubra]
MVVRALIRCSSSTIRSRRSLCSESLEAYSRRMALVTISIEIDQFGLTCAVIAVRVLTSLLHRGCLQRESQNLLHFHCWS